MPETDTQHIATQAERDALQAAEDARIYNEGHERAAARDDAFEERLEITNELQNPYLADWERKALEARLRTIQRAELGNNSVLVGGVVGRRPPVLTAEAKTQIAEIDAELEKTHGHDTKRRLELCDRKLKLFAGG